MSVGIQQANLYQDNEKQLDNYYLDLDLHVHQELEQSPKASKDCIKGNFRENPQ